MSDEILGKVTEISLQTCERVYHLKINYNNNDYFYIVETLYTPSLNDFITRSIHRGHSYWDCGLRLKNSEKKKISRMIEQYIREI